MGYKRCLCPHVRTNDTMIMQLATAQSFIVRGPKKWVCFLVQGQAPKWLLTSVRPTNEGLATEHPMQS